jgi:hypothetical protein
MENQGKRKQQIEDSENFVSIAIVGILISLFCAIAVELFF